MSLTIELENGRTATLRDPSMLTNGQRRPIMEASTKYVTKVDPEVQRALVRAIQTKNEQQQQDLMSVIQLGADPGAARKITEIAIVVLVESWTLELPIPSKKPVVDGDGMLIGSEVLDEISAWDYDRLDQACTELLPQVRWAGGPPAGKAPRSSRSKAR